MEGNNSKHNSTASLSSTPTHSAHPHHTLFDIGAQIAHSLHASHASIQASLISSDRIRHLKYPSSYPVPNCRPSRIRSSSKRC